MQRKIIHIPDPLADAAEYTKFKKLHEDVADKVHVALFMCIYKFFKDWHVDCMNWKKKYEIVVSDTFSK
jgi:hypothetical protein